jgi:hypothetical protein
MPGKAFIAVCSLTARPEPESLIPWLATAKILVSYLLPAMKFLTEWGSYSQIQWGSKLTSQWLKFTMKEFRIY